jgi:hypothetical protein
MHRSTVAELDGVGTEYDLGKWLLHYHSYFVSTRIYYCCRNLSPSLTRARSSIRDRLLSSR